MADDRTSQYENRQYINVETFRKNGVGVQTPVWFVQEGDILYLRTGEDSWKVKRIRNNPSVRVVPSQSRGQPLGEWQAARARIVEDPQEVERVNQAMKSKYGLLKGAFDWYARLSGSDHVTVALKLNPEEE